MAADRVLLVELSLYGQFCEIPERLFFRREHPRASSSNKSLESQQEFFDPITKGRIFLLSWKQIFQYFAIVMHASFNACQKFRLFFIILRRAVTLKRRLAKELLSGLRQFSRKVAAR
jgi:hypothetical protein